MIHSRLLKKGLLLAALLLPVCRQQARAELLDVVFAAEKVGKLNLTYVVRGGFISSNAHRESDGIVTYYADIYPGEKIELTGSITSSEGSNYVFATFVSDTKPASENLDTGNKGSGRTEQRRSYVAQEKDYRIEACITGRLSRDGEIDRAVIKVIYTVQHISHENPYAPGGKYDPHKDAPHCPYCGLIDSFIRFNDFYGEVSIRCNHEEDDSYEMAEFDKPIFEDDRIQTKEESGAILGLEDMSTYVIHPESILIIHSEEEEVSKLEILRGVIVGNIKKMMEGKTIGPEMSQCVAGIKGTVFALEETGTESRAWLFTSKMEIRSKKTGKVIDLKPGQMSVVGEDGEIKVEEFDIDEKAREFGMVRNGDDFDIAPGGIEKTLAAAKAAKEEKAKKAEEKKAVSEYGSNSDGADDESNNLLYIIIGAVAVLLLAGSIVAIFLSKKKWLRITFIVLSALIALAIGAGVFFFLKNKDDMVTYAPVSQETEKTEVKEEKPEQSDKKAKPSDTKDDDAEEDAEEEDDDIDYEALYSGVWQSVGSADLKYADLEGRSDERTAYIIDRCLHSDAASLTFKDGEAALKRGDEDYLSGPYSIVDDGDVTIDTGTENALLWMYTPDEDTLYTCIRYKDGNGEIMVFAIKFNRVE